MSGSDFNKSIRQFKLTNGDEIVCDVVEWPSVDDDHNGLVVRNAYKIFMINPISTETRYYQFRPWLVYQDNKEFFQIINADHIVAEATPADELLIHYYRIVNDITDDNLEEKLEELAKTLKEYMTDENFNDSDVGNLIKFPGNKKLH